MWPLPHAAAHPVDVAPVGDTEEQPAELVGPFRDGGDGTESGEEHFTREVFRLVHRMGPEVGRDRRGEGRPQRAEGIGIAPGGGSHHVIESVHSRTAGPGPTLGTLAVVREVLDCLLTFACGTRKEPAPR